MKNTKIYLQVLLLATVLIFALPRLTRAGGFPVRPGSLLLSPSVNYFFANKGWDSLRRTKPFDAQGRFHSINYSLYAEYGISRRLTFVALLPYAMNTYSDSTGKNNKQTNGLTDLEAGVRYYIANINYIYYFTIQGTFIMPMYTHNDNLGYGQKGGEVKLAFAGSGHLFSKNYYFTLENGVRQYFGSQGPLQDRYTATFGLTLDRKFKQQLSASFGGFYSTSSFNNGYDPTKIASNKNFAFNQVSLSYGYSFSKQFSIFLTAGKFISGRNTGNGSSAAASFVIRPF